MCIITVYTYQLLFLIWLFCRSLAVGSKSGYKFFSLSSVDKLEQIYECSKCLLYFSPFLKKIDKLYLNWNAFSNSNTVIEAPIPPDQYSSLPLILTDGACSPGSVRVRTYTCTHRNTCFMGCFFQHMILRCMYYSVISPHFKCHYLNHLGFCDTGLPGKPPWE